MSVPSLPNDSSSHPPAFSKKIICDPSTPVVEIAVQVVTDRLRQVEWLFTTLASVYPEDPDTVRRLRVATRRASTALRMFDAFFDQSMVAYVFRDLSKIRKAGGKVRDLDVLMGNLQEHNPNSANLPGLAVRRLRAKSKLDRTYQKYIFSGRFANGIQQLVQSAKPSRNTSDQLFGSWAHARLTTSSHSLFEEWTTASTLQDHPYAALHDLRLIVKRLRYQLEILGSAFPKKQRSKVHRRLKALQTDLGEINDHDVAIRNTFRWMRDADPIQRSRLKYQLKYAWLARDRALQDFQRRWTSTSRGELESNFGIMLSQDIPTDTT